MKYRCRRCRSEFTCNGDSLSFQQYYKTFNKMIKINRRCNDQKKCNLLCPKCRCDYYYNVSNRWIDYKVQSGVYTFFKDFMYLCFDKNMVDKLLVIYEI